MNAVSKDREEVRAVLESWAEATRLNQQGNILKNHAEDLVIFDVLPPMKYTSARSYRASWGEWQPQTQGETHFELEEPVVITAGVDMAAAHCFIRCGGVTPEGTKFEDLVRATFCLRKVDGSWQVFHQHVSKPWTRAAQA